MPAITIIKPPIAAVGGTSESGSLSANWFDGAL
jgi:hypothetical protein